MARKYQPSAVRRDIEDIDCADVLSIYLNDVGEPGDQFEIEARIDRLNDFWGGKKLSAVNAQAYAAFVKHRGKQGGARRDLETLRAAINHHAKEGFHRRVVRVSLPPNREARDRWLTRKEAAALVWHCWRYRENQTIHTGTSKGDLVRTDHHPDYRHGAAEKKKKKGRYVSVVGSGTTSDQKKKLAISGRSGRIEPATLRPERSALPG